MNWFIGIAILVVVGYLLDREVYFYEGVHLGPRVQAWLYDRWSRKYDDGKRGSQLRDDEMLAQPLLDATKDVPTPFVLDFATGTGRLSYALTSRPEIQGAYCCTRSFAGDAGAGGDETLPRFDCAYGSPQRGKYAG